MLEAYRTDTSPYVFLSLERLRRIGRSMAAGKWRADSRLVNNTLRAFQAIHEAAKLPEPAGTLHDARKT